MSTSIVRKLIELDAASRKRIAVIGDVLVDRYIHGRLADCQDGCQKFVEESRTECMGGAANAERSLLNWKCDSNCFGNMEDNAPIKTRFVVNGKIIMRHDMDAMKITDRLRTWELDTLLDWSPDAMLISDYDKGFLTPALIRQVIDAARERGIPCVADAKREPELYAGAILKCNADYANAYREVMCRKDTVITTGSAFPTIVHENDTMTKTPSQRPVTCVNHVGAGDCFAAHLTLALAHGFSLEDAAAIAHSASRVYVQHAHNRPPMPEEVARDFERTG